MKCVSKEKYTQKRREELKFGLFPALWEGVEKLSETAHVVGEGAHLVVLLNVLVRSTAVRMKVCLRKDGTVGLCTFCFVYLLFYCKRTTLPLPARSSPHAAATRRRTRNAVCQPYQIQL